MTLTDAFSREQNAGCVVFTVRSSESIVPKTMRASKTTVRVLGAAILFSGLGCAPVVKRDLSTIPVGQVGFDDLCDLQTYYDKLATKEGTNPTVVLSAEIERERPGVPRSGRSRFAFETDFQVQAARRVLKENWKRLPDEISTASRIDLEVRWSERSGVRRVVTNEDAALIIDKTESSLPYHPCLSEFLFGEPLYKQRREVLGLAPLPAAAAWLAGRSPDGGAADRSAGDAGTTGTAADAATDGR
ncbi:MAG: hypothetical protein ABUS79_11080 [Pseudomonadota bacterium]